MWVLSQEEIHFCFEKVRPSLQHNYGYKLQQLKMKSDPSWITYYTLHFKAVTLSLQVFLEEMFLKGRQINWKILVVE